jgi:hypothetical protein
VAETVRFERRFQGFTDGALGGYAAGVAARGIVGPAEANLRALPPLDRELSLHRDGERAELRDGETLVVEVAPASFELDVPGPIELDRARVAAASHPVAEPENHVYPHCFTCGPGRDPADGLNVFVGRVDGNAGLLACAWSPDPAHANSDGRLDPELIWAALDCPTIWATEALGEPIGATFRVLARQRVEIAGSVSTGEACVVSAWPISRDGRKYLSGAAIHGADGELLARCEALLIEVPRG